MPDARIFADLKRDHDLRRVLLEQLGETGRDSEKRRSLFDTFCVEVSAHAAAGELAGAEEARLAQVLEDRKPRERERAEATPPERDERE